MPARQRTLRIPDAVWSLLLDVAAQESVGVAELMVEASLDAVSRRHPTVRERAAAARSEYRRRGLRGVAS